MFMETVILLHQQQRIWKSEPRAMRLITYEFGCKHPRLILYDCVFSFGLGHDLWSHVYSACALSHDLWSLEPQLLWTICSATFSSGSRTRSSIGAMHLSEQQ